MLKYVFLVVLIIASGLDAYKVKSSQNRVEEPILSDYQDYDYDYSGFAKDAEETTTRPAIFKYWTNFLKRARLPSLNITNPFTKLFTPYVIKVDFPPGTDPNELPQTQLEPKPMRKKNKKKPDTMVYADTYPETSEAPQSQYFYDPITQQYYEILEKPSDDYDPQNGYYATTFNNEKEVVINLGDILRDQNQALTYMDGNQKAAEKEQGQLRSVAGVRKGSSKLRRYNSPSYAKLKSKRVNAIRNGSQHYRSNRRTSVRPPRIGLLAIV